MLLSSALFLAACGTSDTSEPADMGGAIPQPSPIPRNPDGRVIPLPAGQDAVSDLERANGDILGVRTPSALSVGSIGAFGAGEQKVLDIDPGCGDLTATGDTFVLPCPQGVYLVDSASPDLSDLRETENPATVAVLTSTGELIAGNNEDATLTIYREGTDPKTFKVASPTDQMIAVEVDGRHDAVYRSNNANTTIQDLDWPNNKMGATLRVGLGVGQIAGGEDGLAVVSDNRGGQIAIYNADDVIRLQMTAPVDQSPWGVAWDAPHALAWIASTSDNQLAGYQISAGVPEEKYRLNTVANALNVVVLDDASLVAASASGDGLQIIDNPASQKAQNQ
ncbi:YncE family protein [Corynebacterium pacaense]|uniref:YncE family protein n=1 Tax=Corynebacterium pacaense TaxID=1816684 RepID=UPI001FEACC0D|nr:hypothetical protein [Corynebacterium pacaense]